MTYDVSTPKRRNSPAQPGSEPLPSPSPDPASAAALLQEKALRERHAGEAQRNFEAFREMQQELAMYRQRTLASEQRAQEEHDALIGATRSAEALEVYETCVGRESAALNQLEQTVRDRARAWDEGLRTPKLGSRLRFGSRSAIMPRASRTV